MSSIKQGLLFRGLCYISLTPFPVNSILPTQTEVNVFIAQLQTAPVQNKLVFVFNQNGEYLRSYPGVMDCARSMNITHGVPQRS